jgi:hypothetical protein
VSANPDNASARLADGCYAIVVGVAQTTVKVTSILPRVALE